MSGVRDAARMGRQPATSPTRRRGRPNGLVRIAALVVVCGAGGALVAATIVWLLLELARHYQ